MRSRQNSPGEEPHTQDWSSSLRPEPEPHCMKTSAPFQTDWAERTRPRTSPNPDGQTLRLTIRLQAEEEEEEEEIGGLINSDGELVEWNTGDSPEGRSDGTEEPQCLQDAVLSERQGQSHGDSGAVGEGGGAPSSVNRGRRDRRQRNLLAGSCSSAGERDVPAEAAKRRSSRKSQGEDFQEDPGISRRRTRRRTLHSAVEPEEFTSRAMLRVPANERCRRRGESTPPAGEKGERTDLSAGKKRPGRKMVRRSVEIPPELLKTPREKVEYHCSVCGKEFPHTYKLERHQLIHTGEKPYSCSICGRGFNQKGNLKTHYKIHLGRKGAVDSDDKVHPEASGLSEYLKSLPGESRICSALRCLDCGKECDSQPVLQAHHVTAHGRSAADPDAAELLFCRRCGDRFSRRDELEEHMKSHVKEKPFSCPDCGKRFINQSYIQIHRRIHTGERPFLCSQCGRDFHTASSLKLHEMQHSGERPFGCTVCGKTFRINSYLTAHYQTHMRDRPFVCGVCGKGYARAEELKVHHRLHTGERPYQCRDCGKSFIYRQGLRQHQRTHGGRRIGPTRQLGRPRQARPDVSCPQ